jgi:hypothetical protein
LADPRHLGRADAAGDLRHAGVAMGVVHSAHQRVRFKALNLLRAEPGAALILDWEGVPSVSSSFADEFVGRLFVELGRLGVHGAGAIKVRRPAPCGS